MSLEGLLPQGLPEAWGRSRPEAASLEIRREGGLLVAVGWCGEVGGGGGHGEGLSLLDQLILTPRSPHSPPNPG